METNKAVIGALLFIAPRRRRELRSCMPLRAARRIQRERLLGNDHQIVEHTLEEREFNG